MESSFAIVNLPSLRRTFCSLSLSLALVCQGQSSRAEVILDNTTSAFNTTNQLNATTTTMHAPVFTSLVGTTLTNMTILPLLISGTTPSTADFTVYLYNVNGSNTPTGAPLASSTITGVSLTKNRSTATTADEVDLNLTTSSTGSWLLASGTSYAVGLLSNNNNAAWAFTSVSPSTADATYLGRALSGDAGINWNAPSAGGTPYIKLVGTAVPEPSTYLLCGLATGVVALVSRNRKKKQA